MSPTNAAFSVRRLPYRDRDRIQVWPDEARMAVLLQVSLEAFDYEHREPLAPHGMPIPEQPDHLPLSVKSAIDYGFHIGAERIIDILDEKGFAATFIVTGNVLQGYPELFRRVANREHEICAHAYSRGTPLLALSRDDQEEEIDRNIAIFEDVLGARPSGWINPGVVCDDRTVELLAQRKFVYHGDLQDDELPYFIDSHGQTLVEIPFRLVGSFGDFHLFTGQPYSVQERLRILEETFDAYYEMAAERPSIFQFAIHPYVSGRPEAAFVYAKFLEYVLEREDVWVATALDMADWWNEQFQDGYD